MPNSLSTKFEMISAFQVFADKAPLLARVRQALELASDEDLFRVNPLRFARQQGLPEAFTVDFFVHASKVGLFDFQWNIICPGCGGIEHSKSSISGIDQASYHCTICNVDVPAELDDQVEVAFHLNEGVRALRFDPFSSFESYRRFFFSANYVRSTELAEYSTKNFVAFAIVAPDREASFAFDVGPGETVRLLSMVSHSQMLLTASLEPGARETEVNAEIAPAGFLRREALVPPGRWQVKVKNLTKHMNATTVLRTDFAALARIMTSHPNHREPFLTAKMLLNNQSFKDLFRVQELPKDLNLRVRSLTLLFTDLKGSTSLYSREGDLRAFNVVQEHFKVLTAVVRAHSGAVVKTMGDAVMAAFSSSIDAVRAAIEMLKVIEVFRVEHGVPSMGLKVGVHEGPALVVNADERLDFFGQTVNAAARIQGQAKAGELVLSEHLYADPAIQAIVGQSALGIELSKVRLRGIEGLVPLYHIAVT